MRLLFRTRPRCLDQLCAGELPATRDCGVSLSLTPSLTLSQTQAEGESEQKETSCGSRPVTLPLKRRDITLHSYNFFFRNVRFLDYLTPWYLTVMVFRYKHSVHRSQKTCCIPLKNQNLTAIYSDNFTDTKRSLQGLKKLLISIMSNKTDEYD
jgi:hypothetical protein